MNNRPAASRVQPGNVPNTHHRQSTPRSHAHSLSVGSQNTSRVDRRRKSTSSYSSAAAAAAQALGLVAEPSDESGTLSSKVGRRIGLKPSPKPAYASSLPASSGFGQSTFEANPSSVIVESPLLEALPEADLENKSRVRRASDGARLLKAEAKRQVNGELKCETCGKGYKHSSCLHKHLWEHTPEWALTSKLLISKHQQVQLLEAASVLVQMNQNAVDSDISSPEASSSDLHSDAISSKDSSPQPQSEDHHISGITAERLERKRFSGNSSTYSHSYQSSVFSDGRHHNVHSRQVSSDNRPTTAGTSATSYTEEERDEMSAAFNLLSCGYVSTPKTGPVAMGGGIPPVPPLPAKYLGQSLDHLSGSTITGVPHPQNSFVRGSMREDIHMVEEEDSQYPRVRRGSGRSDDEEEGMFGRMEE